MLDVLHVWGYTPEMSTSDGGRTARLVLKDCPFLALASRPTRPWSAASTAA